MADENECQMQDIENNNNNNEKKKRKHRKKECSRKTKIIRSSSNIENFIIIYIFFLSSSLCLFLSFPHSLYPPPFPSSKAIQVVEASANGRKLPTGGYVDLIVCPWLSAHLGANPSSYWPPKPPMTTYSSWGKERGGDIWSHDTCNSNNNRYDFKSGNNDSKKWKSKEKKNVMLRFFFRFFPSCFIKERGIASFCFLVLLDIYLCLCLKED